MFNKEELFKNLAVDFKVAVEKYRVAREDKDIQEPHFSFSDEIAEEKYNKDEDKRRDSINTSKDYIRLTREEYWKNILISKIEVIGAIGGFELMDEFSKYLRKIDTNELMLESAFGYYADGICGWCR